MSRIPGRFLTVLALAGAALFLVFGLKTGPKPSSPAPPLTLADLRGRPVSLADHAGQVVLLDFWATWCDPCIEELPDLIRLHETYKDRGFTVLAASMDEEPSLVPSFVLKHKIPYPVLITGGLVPPGYDFPGIPTAFLIDRRGIVARKYFGPKTYASLANDVEEVLQ